MERHGKLFRFWRKFRSAGGRLITTDDAGIKANPARESLRALPGLPGIRIADFGTQVVESWQSALSHSAIPRGRFHATTGGDGGAAGVGAGRLRVGGPRAGDVRAGLPGRSERT